VTRRWWADRSIRWFLLAVLLFFGSAFLFLWIDPLGPRFVVTNDSGQRLEHVQLRRGSDLTSNGPVLGSRDALEPGESFTVKFSTVPSFVLWMEFRIPRGRVLRKVLYMDEDELYGTSEVPIRIAPGFRVE
jgi:hypothetical protein